MCAVTARANVVPFTTFVTPGLYAVKPPSARTVPPAPPQGPGEKLPSQLLKTIVLVPADGWHWLVLPPLATISELPGTEDQAPAAIDKSPTISWLGAPSG